MENASTESLEIKNKDGNTPLQIASLKKRIYIIHKLLLIGADIHTINKHTETPLHSAIRSGSKEVVRVLLMNGSSIHELNKLGQSALHVAVLTPKKELNIVKLLVSSGSDILNIDKKNNDMLANLSQQPTSQINSEINTYLTNACFNKYENDQESYKQLLIKHPDFSPYEIESEDEDEEFTKKDINGIDITYDDQLNDNELYHDKVQRPQKVLPRNIKKYIEHFESNVSQTDNINTRLYFLYIIFIIMIMYLVYNNY
jgi:ankyrin repeat protein